MELKIPSSGQAYWGLRAMKTVALADGALNDSEVHMIASVQRVIGTDHPVDDLDPITPVELAQALPDQQLRQQLVQGLIVMSLIDGEASRQETELIEQFAQALEVSVPEVKNLRHVLEGEILHLRLDLARRFWVDKIKEVWKEEGLRGLFKIVGGMLGQYETVSWRAATRLWNIVPLIH